LKRYYDLYGKFDIDLVLKTLTAFGLYKFIDMQKIGLALGIRLLWADLYS
jgi:hypothetical protein